jgi:hypothetical protein
MTYLDTAALDQLRGLVPEREIEAIGALLAEVQEATSSPEAMRRWESKRAQDQALRTMAERGLRERHGSQVMTDEDPWL